MVKMGKMAPEIERLKKKYGDDKEGLNKAMMQVYKEQGATPILGCLPIFLQMPIWVALYTSLHRMEEKGWVEAEWGTSDKGKRAKFYKITQPGRRALKAETENWNHYVAAVAGVMAAT
jgi:YidC/Oxa1 family membrane protein insertase